MTLKFAFATDDGKTYIDRHFGDADYYDIYEISSNESKFIKRIVNTTEEDDEEIHADPKKAKSVVDLLKIEAVQVVISKVFGPNIKRIKKKFVCGLFNDQQISDSIKTIQEKMNVFTDEWEKGEIRNHINLKTGI
ncbi:MAG: dinitrogenase iron-molybdenum cofactor biosynthesis protein [Bacteroidetes bacterium]|nr:MAG: dinitrogenase iron-molybdenum cofactor biosynthesis protein [Bacteroidota bacterium]